MNTITFRTRVKLMIYQNKEIAQPLVEEFFGNFPVKKTIKELLRSGEIESRIVEGKVLLRINHKKELTPRQQIFRYIFDKGVVTLTKITLEFYHLYKVDATEEIGKVLNKMVRDNELRRVEETYSVNIGFQKHAPDKGAAKNQLSLF